MGCWHETCFITRTPIFAGGKAVMVVLSSQSVAHCLIHDSLVCMHTSLVVRGVYNDYGWLEDLPDAGLGDEPHLRSLFVHEDVWDQILGLDLDDAHLESFLATARHDEELKHRFRDGPSPRGNAFWAACHEWLRVLRFCSLVRVDPACGLAFKGSQTARDDLYADLLDMCCDRQAMWVNRDEQEETV